MDPSPAPSAEDREAVTRLLGRTPQGAFSVVVRRTDGRPVVIRNAPFLDDGTPMPTRYWLLDPELVRAIGTLESEGGVRAAEAEIDPTELGRAHARYAAERDAAIPGGHAGPRPSGGVGGTRTGVKCLHTHYAWYLAGGDDPVGRWVHGRLGAAATVPPVTPSEPTTAPVAAIDCGTNSTRLLIGELDDTGRLVIHERPMTITRLGKGVDATGRLDPAAIERTLTVLREYREVMDHYGVTRVRCAATSASRDASNRDDFFGPAEEILGVWPELVSGDEEAHLSFLGATSDLDPALGPFLVVDIGGGSTEFVFGTSSPEAAISVDIGCVRVTEKFLHGDPPRADELSSALSVIELHLDDVLREIPHAPEARTFVGLAGTITTMAAVEIGLVEHDRERTHHFALTKAAAEDVFRTLATEALADRVHNPGLPEARADVIVGGACVLVQIMRQFGFAECLVSEADILDGLALSILR